MTVTAEATKSNEYVKLVVRRMYDAQKIRIQSDLRMQRLVREGIILKEDAEKDFEKAQRLEVETEKEYEKIVWREIQHMPVVQEWLIKVRGIGPRLAGLLVAIIGDIERFPNVSKLWAYSGLHVIDGRAAKRTKGQKSNWSSELKTTAWKIGQSFVKAGGPYREIYDTYKQYIVARELNNGNIIWKTAESGGKKSIAYAPIDKHVNPDDDKQEWTLGRINNMAMRKIVKLFLSHLWSVWREIEGLEVTEPFVHGNREDYDKPYVQARLGHNSYISPWEMIKPETP